MSDNGEVKEIEGNGFDKVIDYIRENGITHYVVVGLKHEEEGTNFTVLDNINNPDMVIGLMLEVVTTLEEKKAGMKSVIELTDTDKGAKEKPTIQ